MKVDFSDLVIWTLAEASSGGTSTPPVTSTKPAPPLSATNPTPKGKTGDYTLKSIKEMGDAGNTDAKHLYEAIYRLASHVTFGSKPDNFKKYIDAGHNILKSFDKLTSASFAG